MAASPPAAITNGLKDSPAPDNLRQKRKRRKPMHNSVALIGNLGGDPEIRYSSGGTPFATFRLAVNDYAKDAQGNVQQKVSWVPCIAWAKNAEVIGEYALKGTKVGVVGKLSENTWEDSSGNKRSRLEVRVDQVELLSKGRDQSESQRQEQNQRTSSPPPPPDFEPSVGIPF
jgi:single-strand DNA-binding protein